MRVSGTLGQIVGEISERQYLNLRAEEEAAVQKAQMIPAGRWADKTRGLGLVEKGRGSVRN